MTITTITAAAPTMADLYETADAAPVETVTARIARLVDGTISSGRIESLTLAHAAGVDDDTFFSIAAAERVQRDATTIGLPQHKLAQLSRGKGWCRQGRGDSAIWGEIVDGKYRVGPGKWTVGGSDGFARKGQIEWTVEHITVGGKTWTIAD